MQRMVRCACRLRASVVTSQPRAAARLRRQHRAGYRSLTGRRRTGDLRGAARIEAGSRFDRAPLTDAERRRRLERAARYLVRTMNSCPAPGISPLTTRDWLVIAMVVAPYLLVFTLMSMSPTR